MPRDKTNQAAFTLTEVMIAVVLMLLSLGFLLSGFVSSQRSVVLAQSHITAMQLARNDAEQLQTNAYSNIVSATASVTNAYLVYTMSRSVVSVTNSGGDHYKDIAISVTWAASDFSGRQALTNNLIVCYTN